MPETSVGASVPGVDAVNTGWSVAWAFVPYGEFDTEGYGLLGTALGGPAIDPVTGASPVEPGVPDDGVCDNQTSNKVVVGADARAVVCFLDVDNPPNSEVYPPELVTISNHNYIRVGGYSNCVGSTHGRLTRTYEICAQADTANPGPVWTKTTPCRLKHVNGFGPTQLGHDTRCPNKKNLKRRTFVRITTKDTAAWNGQTHTKRVTTPTGGLWLNCGA